MTLVVAIACKVSHSWSSCSPPRVRKRFESLLITLLDGAAHQTVFSVAGNSDSEIPAALQTAETVHKDIVLTPMSFRCSRLVGPGKGFLAISIPFRLCSGLSP